MDNKWQKVDRSDFVEEHFLQGKFITSDKWEKCYPLGRLNLTYLKDSFSFNGISHEFGDNEIPVKNFIHVTSCENAVSIIKDSRLKPGTKDIPGIGKINLLWFGLEAGENEINLVRREYSKCTERILQNESEGRYGRRTANWVANSFANTTSFQPMSRYGNVKFTLSIQNVLSLYEEQFCKGRDGYIQCPAIRKLGTFAYKQETMHVVLVCQPSDELARYLPKLDSYDPIIVSDSILTWRPHSTGQKNVSVGESGEVDTDYDYKRWEHVTFAFVLPDERHLYIQYLDQNVSLCYYIEQIGTKYRIFCIHNAIFNMLQSIQRKMVSESDKKRLADMLIMMIYDFRKEFPLVQEMLKLYKGVIGDNTVQNEWVKLSFKAMLPEEFEKLNWEPIEQQRLAGSFNELHI